MHFSPVLRFAVMSDLHYQETVSLPRDNLRRAMQFVYDYCDTQAYTPLDALYIVGDISDRGHTEQLQLLAQDLCACVRRPTKLVATLANHDLHYVPDMAVPMADFARLFSMPCDRHEVIAGYHFISLSTTIDRGPWHDSFDDAKRRFLTDALAAAAADDPRRPIFVFQHPGQEGTVEGGFFGNREIYDILARYPQVIDFSGHSHMPVNDPRELHQKDYTSLSTGSLYYINCHYDKAVFDGQLYAPYHTAHMLLVEADADARVRVRRLDVSAPGFFERDVWLTDVWDRSRFAYTDAARRTDDAPRFAPQACGDIRSDKKVTAVEFPRADERVLGYEVTLLDGETPVAIRRVISDYPCLHQAPRHTVTLGVAYREGLSARVCALGFFGGRSEPLCIPASG